jgi:hypothetical protein
LFSRDIHVLLSHILFTPANPQSEGQVIPRRGRAGGKEAREL